MTCLHLPPVPASVEAARRWAAPLLPVDVRDSVVLVVSELVTNAVAADAAAGADDDIEVELVVDPAGHVALAVTDASDLPLPDAPVAAPLDEDGGRGLLLVDAIAYDHGWAPRACGGKCVWALVRRPFLAQRWAVSSPEGLECADA
ncbi:ATP-binding protein [Streptomyces sp. MMBL 11-1]|uniref:ATP-binding protein n=1 Tax=Streptomyces sp. MMBL 11-1 TaxID=3026420 RepID=UPI002361B53F|nr:ATP-binding protein [Streptomyces sp. MMBL 11-1]